MKNLPGILFFILLLLTGCSSREDELSVTEQLRRVVDPKVGAFLVEAQEAFEQSSFIIALAMTDSAELYAPELADVHYLRGMIYTRLGETATSNAAYEVVLELDPAYHGARYNMALNNFRTDKLRNAITLLQDEIRYGAGKTTEVMLELGRTYAKFGEPDSARTAYEESIALDSTNTTAHMWLGQLYEELGEYDKALEESFIGLEMKPDHLDYQYIVGTQLYRVDRVEESEQYLGNVAKQRPWHHGAQYNYAQVLVRLGREEEAQRYLVLADSAQQMAQRINDAQNTAKSNPDLPDNWIKLAEHLRYSGQYDKAIEAYQTALYKEPYNMYLQANLATLFMESGDNERAIRRYSAILNFDSTLYSVWLNLGVAYANVGHREGAEASWRRILKYQPDNQAAREFLSRLDEIGAGE